MVDEHNDRPIATWSDLFMRTVELGLGAATLTAETAHRVVNDLVNRGQVGHEESRGMVDRLLALGHEQREALRGMIEKNIACALDRLDLARRSDVEELRLRVAALEHQVFGQAKTSAPIPPMKVDDKDLYVDQE